MSCDNCKRNKCYMCIDDSEHNYNEETETEYHFCTRKCEKEFEKYKNATCFFCNEDKKCKRKCCDDVYECNKPHMVCKRCVKRNYKCVYRDYEFELP